MTIDWHALAFEKKYKDPLQMVVDLYYIKGMSTREISDKLVVSESALHTFMNLHHLPRRNRVSRNRRGPKCIHCKTSMSRIRWTYHKRNKTIRYRKCHNCGKNFFTIEEAINAPPNKYGVGYIGVEEEAD